MSRSSLEARRGDEEPPENEICPSDCVTDHWPVTDHNAVNDIVNGQTVFHLLSHPLHLRDWFMGSFYTLLIPTVFFESENRII